jgi:archaemetzincin
MNIFLVPVKFSNTALLSSVAEELSHKFKGIIKITDIDLNIDKSFSQERAQYFSTQIIANAIKKTDDLNGKVLILTEADLYIPVLTFVFGEAQLNGKHSIVSVCRLHEEFYSEITDEDLLKERAMKEIFHELGHNFGLKHCVDWDCVMHSSTSIEEVDIKGNYYCKKCEKEIN